MKKAKILSVLGILLAMGITACTGGNSNGGDNQSQEAPVSQPGGESQPQSEHKHSYGDWVETKAPTCTEKGTQERTCECGDKQTKDVNALGHDWGQWTVTEEATCAKAGSREHTCSRCQTKETEVIPQLAHDFGDDAEKVDILEVEGSVKEEMFKCKNCDTTSVRWSSLEYDATKTAERSTKSPESRGSGKAIRFDSTANYQDQDTTKKGCHIVYNVYIPEAIEKASIYMKTSKRTDSTLPPVVNIMEDDNAKGYEYVNGELVRPATRYGLKIDGEVVIIPEDTSGQEWKDGINWYSLPGEYKFETAGIHEIEFYNLGGYRADFYEFALVGFGPHEHVANYKTVAQKLNDDGKVVTLGEDEFLNNKSIEIAFKDFHEAPVSPDGTNPWYMKKNSFATWTINVDKAIEGAKLYFSLQAASDTHLERHLFNEAKYNEAHPEDPVKLPSQSPDTTSEDDWRYAVAVGETNYPILNNATIGESGVKETNKQFYVYFADINLAAGANVLKLTQCNMGYRMRFNQNVRIVYSGDATITGEDYVPPVPKVNFKEWLKEDLTAAIPNAASLTSTTYANDIIGYKWNSATNAKATFTYTAAEAGKATFRLLLSAKKGNEANTTFWVYNGSPKTKVTFNGAEVPAPADNFNMSECTEDSATAKDGTSVMKEPVWFNIVDVDLIAGENTITVDFLAGSYSYFLCGAALAK